ncbi:hypothetical protein [Propionibacterium freudenreichii]|uniref:hypothetical protein n=1 Tax=Propionibacterium freudenreichii TaxID=1744 RepID=UPI0005A5C9FC|nr:hypothetical protein [Propionibacterium freudenreichii]MCT2991659.1 hypothetical protein [Propionibacterium freudenreichii]MCT2994079.1 hypothetical protein [Propionibacterium freudenreichii]MDK9651403.1 hypothetical protein [Propionibacterium freudenreichii]MDK9664811.1 hypothetical protein [Propionibacterium freudenreichii]CEI30742.1 Protein of unknown function [Propionibacterium freudenreichii]
MTDSRAEIHDYLTRYAASLAAFDARRAAGLWGTPGMILDDRFAGMLESREAMVRGLEQSYPLYQQLGLDSVGFELLDHQQLSATVVLVHVRWLFLDATGELLTDAVSNYLLRADDDGLRAYVCIETDSAEKLAELAERQGITLPR